MASSADNARVKVCNCHVFFHAFFLFNDEITVFLLVFLKGVTLIKPVIFGNVSHYFGKKRETDGHTHGWTVFLRPFKNEVSGIFTHENEFFEKALDFGMKKNF